MWEEKVQRRLNVVKDEKWLNKQYGGVKFCSDGSPETGRKISKSNKGKSKPSLSKYRKGKVSCFDNRDCEKRVMIVTKEEFDANSFLVGTNSKREISNEWKERLIYYARAQKFKEKRWIINYETGERKFVDGIDTEKYIRKGFVLGCISTYDRKTKMKKCEYCGKVIDVANYAKWHGSKCKNFSILSED